MALQEERLTGGKVATLITKRCDLAYGNWVFKTKNPGAKRGVLHKKLEHDSEHVSDVAALVGDVGKEILEDIEKTFEVITEGQGQSDKLWFLARSLHFTSTVSLQFLDSKNWRLTVDSHSFANSSELLAKECVEPLIEDLHREHLYNVIGIKFNVVEEDANDDLCILTREEIEKKTVAWLKEQCKKRKIKGSSNSNRTRLIETLVQWVPSVALQLTTEQKFAQLAIKSWFMKPRKLNKAMQIGSRNEDLIRKTVTKFLEKHGNLHSIEAREYGLIKRKSSSATRIATSPDMIGAVLISTVKSPNENLLQDNQTLPVVYEFKTFSSLDTLPTASQIAETHGRHITVHVKDFVRNIFELTLDSDVENGHNISNENNGMW